MTVEVTVIIVNYNSGARLARTLEALAQQTYRAFETIVFDNASADGSADIAPPPGAHARIVKHDANIGFAAGNNRAAELAGGRWLAFLNPDAYAEPDWLERLLDAAARHPGVDAFGSTQIDDAEPSRLDGAGDCYHVFGVPYRGHHGWPVDRLPPEGECFAPCAAAALYRAETFRALGGFDETYFCYGEDVDLGFRLRLLGGRAVQVAGARVRHEGSAITGRRSDFTVFHGHRNRIWTYVKNMPAPLLWPALPFHLAVNLYLAARLSLIGSGPAYFRALAAALAGLPRMIAARRAVQASRRIGAGALARALTFSPLRLMRREADIKPMSD